MPRKKKVKKKLTCASVESQTSLMMNSSTKNFFSQRYFKTIKFLMTIIGQWPYQKVSARSGFLAVILFFYVSQFLPIVMAALKYYEDRNILVDCLLSLFYGIWCFIKLLTFLWNSEKMLKMLNHIHDDWHVWTGNREVKILHEYAERARKFTVGYTVTIYSIAFVYLTQPIVPKIIDVVMNNSSIPGIFPIPVYYYYLDEQKYYFYIVGYTYVCMSGVLAMTITYDVVLIVYVQHGCGIFAAVGQKLESIGKNESLSENEEITYHTEATNKNVENLVIFCIHRHNDAIEYAKLVETTYRWRFFVTVVLRIAMISMVGLQIVGRTNEPQETIKFVGFAGGLILYVYIESYIAQIFMDHSTSIRNCIQNGQWYSLSLKTQKLLQFMTMRCNIPCQLTAGKMINMSVESFAVFLKTSMSYLTVLRSV